MDQRRQAFPSTLKPISLAIIATMASMALAGSPTPTEIPTGGNVVAGSAAISQSAASLTINQSSSRAIINWNTFNIGSQASVIFNQPGPSAIALNRVLSADPSAIYGRLSANGQIFLINPAGIVLDSLSAFILGAQGNVWTEYISNWSQVEYMVVPRMIALSESVWSQFALKDSANFQIVLPVKCDPLPP